MTIHAVRSQEVAAESLPIITESATVTSIEAMDWDRSDEIRKQLLSLGRSHGFENFVPGRGAIEWDEVFDVVADQNPRLIGQIGALHERFERKHPSLVRFVIESSKAVDFVAGQYVTLRFGNRSRPYSIASSPKGNQIEFCVKRVPDGKLSPVLCDDLATGDRVSIRGPNGHLHLEDPSSRDVAFFATGTGVAPLKSMIEYLFEAGWDRYDGDTRDIWLFLGAAWKDDLPYHDRFEELQTEYDHFHYVPCVTRETWLSEWNGETDYIQEALMKYLNIHELDMAAIGKQLSRYIGLEPNTDIEARINPHSLEVYACGINAMVFGLEVAVEHVGVNPKYIHGEGYG